MLVKITAITALTINKVSVTVRVPVTAAQGEQPTV